MTELVSDDVTEVVGVLDSEELKLGIDDVDGVNVLVSELEPVGVSLGEGVSDGLIDGVIEGDPAHATNRILHPIISAT